MPFNVSCVLFIGCLRFNKKWNYYDTKQLNYLVHLFCCASQYRGINKVEHLSEAQLMWQSKDCKKKTSTFWCRYLFFFMFHSLTVTQWQATHGELRLCKGHQSDEYIAAERLKWFKNLFFEIHLHKHEFGGEKSILWLAETQNWRTFLSYNILIFLV